MEEGAILRALGAGQGKATGASEATVEEVMVGPCVGRRSAGRVYRRAGRPVPGNGEAGGGVRCGLGRRKRCRAPPLHGRREEAQRRAEEARPRAVEEARTPTVAGART